MKRGSPSLSARAVSFPFEVRCEISSDVYIALVVSPPFEPALAFFLLLGICKRFVGLTQASVKGVPHRFGKETPVVRVGATSRATSMQAIR